LNRQELRNWPFFACDVVAPTGPRRCIRGHRDHVITGQASRPPAFIRLSIARAGSRPACRRAAAPGNSATGPRFPAPAQPHQVRARGRSCTLWSFCRHASRAVRPSLLLPPVRRRQNSRIADRAAVRCARRPRTFDDALPQRLGLIALQLQEHAKLQRASSARRLVSTTRSTASISSKKNRSPPHSLSSVRHVRGEADHVICVRLARIGALPQAVFEIRHRLHEVAVRKSGYARILLPPFSVRIVDTARRPESSLSMRPCSTIPGMGGWSPGNQSQLPMLRPVCRTDRCIRRRFCFGRYHFGIAI